jgi:heptosyltransferase-2
MKIGIVLPNWIGDAVMATPALRSLRESVGSEATLVGIMKPVIADVLDGTEWLDECVLYDRRSTDHRLRMRAVAADLRRRRLDQMLLLTNSLSSGVLAWRSGAPSRVGSARYGRRLLLTDALPIVREKGRINPYSPVDHYLQVVSLGRDICESRAVELTVPESDRQLVDHTWKKLGFDDDRPVVVFNNGGGYGAAKRWPTERFVELARRVVSETDASVLLVCGPAEQADAAEFEEQADHRRIRSLARFRPAIGLTKACVQKSAVVVSTDSGVRHFAAAFGIPSVALFGPMIQAASENYHAAEIRLQLELPCSPCGKRVCPLEHHRCMRDLSVSSVYEALTRQLTQESQSAA